MDCIDHGEDALDLLVHIDRLRTRSRRFSAYIENLGTVFEEMFRLPERLLDGIAVVNQPIARERVGRDVEDAHHICAGPPIKNMITNVKSWELHAIKAPSGA